MIISTISRGRRSAGDERFADVLGEAWAEQDLRIMARLLYQTRIASSLMTVAKI
jgi:hypothetical protein